MALSDRCNDVAEAAEKARLDALHQTQTPYLLLQELAILVKELAVLLPQAAPALLDPPEDKP
jgi:hypothetical protein